MNHRPRKNFNRYIFGECAGCGVRGKNSQQGRGAEQPRQRKSHAVSLQSKNESCIVGPIRELPHQAQAPIRLHNNL